MNTIGNVTTREDLIHGIAEMMKESDSVDPEGGRTRAQWDAVNAKGWTVDLGTWHDNYERQEGVILSPAEMDRACALAEEWLAKES